MHTRDKDKVNQYFEHKVVFIGMSKSNWFYINYTQPSQNVFQGQVIWKLEAVWVPKARFQVSLGCGSVAGFQGIPPWKKELWNFDAQGCHDRTSDRMRWCGSAANIRILCIIRAIFHIKQKNCAILAIKQLPYNPTSKNSEEIDYFEVVFLLKQKPKQAKNFQPQGIQTYFKQRAWNLVHGKCLVTKLQMLHKCNKCCTWNELKCYRKTV